MDFGCSLSGLVCGFWVVWFWCAAFLILVSLIYLTHHMSHFRLQKRAARSNFEKCESKIWSQQFELLIFFPDEVSSTLLSRAGLWLLMEVQPRLWFKVTKQIIAFCNFHGKQEKSVLMVGLNMNNYLGCNLISARCFFCNMSYHEFGLCVDCLLVHCAQVTAFFSTQFAFFWHLFSNIVS